jgi:hypothetical protein
VWHAAPQSHDRAFVHDAPMPPDNPASRALFCEPRFTPWYAISSAGSSRTTVPAPTPSRRPPPPPVPPRDLHRPTARAGRISCAAPRPLQSGVCMLNRQVPLELGDGSKNEEKFAESACAAMSEPFRHERPAPILRARGTGPQSHMIPLESAGAPRSRRHPRLSAGRRRKGRGPVNLGVARM